MSEPHGAVATRSSWRKLPPYPPYGPIPPPRPEGIDAAPVLEVAGEEVPPGRALAYIGLGLLVVALGIGVGLYLTRDAGQQTAVDDPPTTSSRPQPQIVPVTPAPAPDPDPIPQPTPAPSDMPGDPPPSDAPPPAPEQQPPATQPDQGQPGGAPQQDDAPSLDVLRIFVVDPPEGFTETATMVSEEQADGRTFAEQTSVLSGAVGEVAIHAVLAPGAGERVDELLDGGEISDTLDIAGRPAWQLAGNSLVWLLRDDLYIEIGAPEAVPVEDLIALAESLEILR